jgi:hypothetical protein
MDVGGGNAVEMERFSFPYVLASIVTLSRDDGN